MNESSDRIAGFEEYKLLWIQKWYLKALQPIVQVLVICHVDPNMITLLSITLSVIAMHRIGTGQWIAAIVLIISTGLCDMLDGPVAREIERQKKHRSAFGLRIGAIIDPIADRICDICFLGGLNWYVALYHGHVWGSLVYWSMVAYLLSSWLRTFMGSKGYQVINHKPLTRTLFFVALIAACITIAICEKWYPEYEYQSIKFCVIAILGSTLLPLLYRSIRGMIAVWRAQ